MGLGDVSGVLSRYFIVGFWVPSFFSLSVLTLVLKVGAKPQQYNELNWGHKLLVIGGLSLLTGLALLGLRYPITRLFEGYWPEVWPLRYLKHLLRWVQRRAYLRLKSKRGHTEDEAASTQAARLLDRRFPRDAERLLPTRLGNAIRASENYSYTRYGLDAIAIWPRIHQMLTPQEQELHMNAGSDLAFFMNSSLGALAVAVALAASTASWWKCVLSLVISYALYRAAVGAAERVGTERRASIDLHRIELYAQLGLAGADASEEERRSLAGALNDLLLYGKQDV